MTVRPARFLLQTVPAEAAPQVLDFMAKLSHQPR
jgi:hypothetical protein